jgi:hypothetical protein
MSRASSRGDLRTGAARRASAGKPIDKVCRTDVRQTLSWPALLALVAGCGRDCYLELIEGSDDNHDGLVHQGDQLRFRAHLDDETVECGGIWLVNGIVGGSPGFGTIDECGNYAAPAVYPTGIVEVEIEMFLPSLGQLGTACEHVSTTLYPVP